jgi:O-antigen ligase
MGLLTLLIVIVLAIILGENKLKRTAILLLTIVGLVIIYNVYIELPENLHVLEIDLYIERMQEKIEQMVVGDYEAATTGRSEIAKNYLRYIFIEQNVFKLFFGANPQVIESVSSHVPHNTYLSILLQSGLIGTFAFFAYSISRLVKITKHNYYKPYIILKVLSLVVAFSLSLYAGNMWAIWAFFLLLL